ncbi:MAG TPA: F0F1 ATP synthase subunit beta, partial [Deltaproteobacteria bacterium]|nr:F0F1 ATP synthase subunit beta [Deltaproteobacteria bacterium]
MEEANRGTIVSVRGSVIDAYFPSRLPAIFSVLKAGDNQEVTVEVNTHLNAGMVRGVALTPTQGLARGSEIIDLGLPLQVPVGKSCLGRVMNVFGEAIDFKGEIPGELRSIHQKPVPLTQQSTVSEIFTTGIKAIDVLAPL